MTDQIERHLTANAYISKKDIIIGNLLGGLAWGFGTVIGATIVVGVVVWILRTFGIFETLGIVLEQAGQLRELNSTLPTNSNLR